MSVSLNGVSVKTRTKDPTLSMVHERFLFSGWTINKYLRTRSNSGVK